MNDEELSILFDAIEEDIKNNPDSIVILDNDLLKSIDELVEGVVL